MKVVDTNTYVSILKELTDQGKEVSLLISGNSMEPFLKHQRDIIFFQKPERELAVGDIVFYQRRNGQYVVHRIYAIREDGYYILGDGQSLVEGPIQREQIFGLITKVQRKGRWIGPKHFVWKFFVHIWPKLRPIRAIIMRGYRGICRRLRRE